jgi:hypothetical protein
VHFTLIPAAPDWWVTHWYLGVLIGGALVVALIASLRKALKLDRDDSTVGAMFAAGVVLIGFMIIWPAIQGFPRSTGVLNVASSTISRTVAHRVERARTALGFPLAVDPAVPAISSARLTQTLTTTPTAPWHGWTLLSAVWMPTTWALRHTAIAPTAIRPQLVAQYTVQLHHASTLLLQTVHNRPALYHTKTLAVSAITLPPAAATGLQDLASHIPQVCTVPST